MFQPPIWINIHIHHTSTSSVKQDQRYEKKNREGTSSELQEIVVTKPTISMPFKGQNSRKIEEHELQEFKPRKVVNLRPLPPLRASPPVVTYPTNSTSRKRPEIELLGI